MNNKTKELWNKVERYGTGGLAEETVDEILAILEQQQDICYCKDCEIRNKDGYCMRQMTLNLITMVKDTDYCSWGERIELPV